MRIALTVLLGLVLAIALALATLLWLLDNDDYRGLATWLADTTLDAELTLGDDFDLTLGRRLGLRASDVRLATRDGTLSLALNTLDTTVDLWALRRSTLLIVTLTASGGRVRWTETAGLQSPSRERSRRLLPFAQHLAISDLDIEIDPAGGSEPMRLAVSALTLSAADETTPMALHFAGTTSGRSASIDGTLGSARQIFSPPADGFPVQLDFKGPHATATCKGVIGDPIGLTGSDLTVTYATDSVHTSLAPFIVLPDLGSADVSGRLTGDLREPDIQDLSAKTSRPGLTLAVTGRLPNALRIAGSTLDVYATVNPPALAPEVADRVTHVSLQGTLTGTDGALALSSLKGTAHVDGYGDLELGGDATVQLAAAGATAHVEVTLSSHDAGPASAPSGELLARLPTLSLSADYGHTDRSLEADVESIGDDGDALDAKLTATFDEHWTLSQATVDGHTRIVRGSRASVAAHIATDADGLELEQLTVRDETSNAQLTATGSLGKRQANGAWGPVAVAVRGTGDGGHLLGALDLDNVAGIDALDLDLRIEGSTDRLTIPELAIDVGGDKGIKGRLTGRIAALSPSGVSGVQGSATVTAPSTTNVGAAFGRPTFPDLGVVALDASVTDADGSLGLDSLTLTITRDDTDVLKLTGAINDIMSRSDIRWEGTANIDLTTLLAPWIEPGIALGRLKGQFVIADDDGTLGLESFTLSAVSDTLHSSSLSGSFDDFTNFSDLKAQAEIDIVDTQTLNRLLGGSHGIAGPIKLSGTLAGSSDGAHYDGLLTIGRNRIDTQLSVDLSLDRPRITASIVAPVLHPDDIGFGHAHPSAEPAAAPASTSERLFSDAPLDFSWLDRQDLDLTLRIESVPSDEFELKNFEIRARVDAGTLTLDRWQATYSGGALVGTGRLTNGTPPDATLKLTGDDVAFGEAMELLTGSQAFRAEMSTRSEVSTKGHSLHEMMSNLSGQIGIVMEHGEFPRRIVDLIGGDLFGWTMSTVSRRATTAHFDCIIGRFSIDAGVINTEALFLDGPGLAMTGVGTINLGAETIDAKILPKPKRQFWRSTSPVHLTGSLKAPTVTVIPARAMAQQIGALALVPQFYLPVRALGYMYGAVTHDKKDSPCLTTEDRDVLSKGLPAK